MHATFHKTMSGQTEFPRDQATGAFCVIRRLPHNLRLNGLAALVLVGALLWARTAQAVILVTKSGMLFEGDMAQLASIDENPLVANVPEGAVEVSQIVMLDDGLRRTFLSRHQIQMDLVRESDPSGNDRVVIRQQVASGRRQIGSVTSILNIGTFDQFGRRTFSLLTPQGPVDVVQGITEITPLYTRLEGLQGTPSIRWDCRVATNSIPRETISQVIRRQARVGGADARLQAVRLLFAAERYNDARIELMQAMQEYPDLGDYGPLLEQLRQLTATRMLDEIQLRRAAGQHQRVNALLSQFPEEGIAAQTLLRVGELLREQDQAEQRREQTLSQVEAIAKRLPDPAMQTEIEPILKEIRDRLNTNSQARLEDFQRLQDDPMLPDDAKLSLAISGWILGSGNATQNLIEALSVFRVHKLVNTYLRSKDSAERTAILEQLGKEEGGSPPRVAQILQMMVPPLPTEPQPDQPPGHFKIQVPGIPAGEVFEYEVQLPDEYDPYRRYPAIVTLNPPGRTEGEQIDWWAGTYDPELRQRTGQAMRHGYIVIAPKWLEAGQRQYGYTGQEHARTVFALRDACRRFSIDTDRVFLSGHSTGGDAAWDIGLAHPDLWAGVIPIVAVAEYGGDAPKYVSLYWENARSVPLYFVSGELDGNKLELNRRDFDRYLKNSGIDATIVEYMGRGHEHFYDEIHRLFTWMNLQRRPFHRPEFTYHTMRSFDNFCWNLELQGLPPESIASPLAWSTANARPAVNSFSKNANGTITLTTGAAQAWMYMSPEIIPLEGRVTVMVNSVGPRTYEFLPKLDVMLEDARTRVDRQHVYWSRAEMFTGKRARR
jgi:pimeloyl-ACP methyl ester carboxylesterase